MKSKHTPLLMAVVARALSVNSIDFRAILPAAVVSCHPDLPPECQGRQIGGQGDERTPSAHTPPCKALSTSLQMSAVGTSLLRCRAVKAQKKRACPRLVSNCHRLPTRLCKASFPGHHRLSARPLGGHQQLQLCENIHDRRLGRTICSLYWKLVVVRPSMQTGISELTDLRESPAAVAAEHAHKSCKA